MTDDEMTPDDRCAVCFAPSEPGQVGKDCQPCADMVENVKALIALGWTQAEINALVVDTISTLGDVGRAEAADATRTLIAELADRRSAPGDVN